MAGSLLNFKCRGGSATAVFKVGAIVTESKPMRCTRNGASVPAAWVLLGLSEVYWTHIDAYYDGL
ncbi:hypothetical protein D3C86_2078820 [compost metagenome]